MLHRFHADRTRGRRLDEVEGVVDMAGEHRRNAARREFGERAGAAPGQRAAAGSSLDQRMMRGHQSCSPGGERVDGRQRFGQA